jgi:hypothetical protein
MKTLIFGSLAAVAVLLVAVQHQRLGQLWAENVTLEQSSAEAERLKADLANSTGNEAQDEDEVNRLREENRDLLKLRNEVYQLREAKAVFEKVSAENQRLQLVARSAPKPATKDGEMQPIVARADSLVNRGLNTPESAVLTAFWARRNQDLDQLSLCVVAERVPVFRDNFNRGMRQSIGEIESIEIVARRDIDATNVELGIVLRPKDDSRPKRNIIVLLTLRGSDWKLDMDSF